MAKIEKRGYVVEVEVPGVLDAYPEGGRWCKSWLRIVIRIWPKGNLPTEHLREIRDKIISCFLGSRITVDLWDGEKKIVVRFENSIGDGYEKLISVVDDCLSNPPCEICGVLVQRSEKLPEVVLCKKCQEEIDSEKRYKCLVA